MSKRRDKDYLSDIIEAIERTAEYTKGLTYSNFIKDKKTQDAVIRNLEVIGELNERILALTCKNDLTKTCQCAFGSAQRQNYRPIAE